MKTSKFLVFSVGDQKLALRTNFILNIIENARIGHHLIDNCSCDESNMLFKFKGLEIPLINLEEKLNLKSTINGFNKSVLVIEMQINNQPKLAGILITEVLEVVEFEDFFAYPYIPVKKTSQTDIREGVIVINNESVIVINSNKLAEKNSFAFSDLSKIALYAN
jgi:chemotaxis signal transduction protein